MESSLLPHAMADCVQCLVELERVKDSACLLLILM